MALSRTQMISPGTCRRTRMTSATCRAFATRGSLPARSPRPISCSLTGSTAVRPTRRTRAGSSSPASISILRTQPILVPQARGAAGGKPQFSSLNVTLPQEAGLADVMGLAATGGLIKGVRIEGFTGGTTPAKVYELTLADVAATKVADGEDGGYSLSLDYGKIALVTKTENRHANHPVHLRRRSATPLASAPTRPRLP